jgi:spermidine/putrescine transport system permease protein
MFVYGLLKQRVPPEINAVSTLMILASLVLVAVSLLLQRGGVRRRSA